MVSRKGDPKDIATKGILEHLNPISVATEGLLEPPSDGIFTYVGSGGIVTDGAAGLSFRLNVIASGGVGTGGTAGLSFRLNVTASGGVGTGGTAAESRTFAVVGSSGVGVGGEADPPVLRMNFPGFGIVTTGGAAVTVGPSGPIVKQRGGRGSPWEPTKHHYVYKFLPLKKDAVSTGGSATTSFHPAPPIEKPEKILPSVIKWMLRKPEHLKDVKVTVKPEVEKEPSFKDYYEDYVKTRGPDKNVYEGRSVTTPKKVEGSSLCSFYDHGKHLANIDNEIILIDALSESIGEYICTVNYDEKKVKRKKDDDELLMLL